MDYAYPLNTIGKQEYMKELLGPRQTALMREIKRAFDPNDILNPGKISE